MLIVILAEAALETVPEELWAQPTVQSHAMKRKKHPKLTILDRSYHHAAMRYLKNGEKRGRPDIIHFSLLEALSSPLNREGLLKVYVHTVKDQVICVNPETRLPRNYERFIGLMEQLFEFGVVPKTGSPLLRLEQKTLPQLLGEIKSTHVMALSRIGSPRTLEDVISEYSAEDRLTVVIGGFPRGHFSEETTKLADEVVSIDPEMLETWTVTSRVIYEYERAISLSEKRLNLR